MFGALFWGIIIGSYFAHKQSHYLNLLYVMFKFRKKERFEDLYELCDTEFSFQMSSATEYGPKTYHEFLKRHEKARAFAGDAFVNLYRATSKMLLRNYLVVLALGLIIFRSNVWLFLGSFFVCQIAYQLYLYHYKDNKIDFNATRIHNFIINDKRVRSGNPLEASD